MIDKTNFRQYKHYVGNENKYEYYLEQHLLGMHLYFFLPYLVRFEKYFSQVIEYRNWIHFGVFALQS